MDKYSISNLVFIIPTINGGMNLFNLLNSLTELRAGSPKLIIVDYCKTSKLVINPYMNLLDIIYINSDIPGQIFQRNLGLKNLSKDHKLVGFIDNDLIFHIDSIDKMLNQWNTAGDNVGGIGFNICYPKNKFLVRNFLISSGLYISFLQPGRILNFGHNNSIGYLNKSIQSQWLGGGYTIWQRFIVDNFKQEKLRTKWAIGEDLRYSYPIGKKFLLLVSSDAKVYHPIESKENLKPSIYFYRGFKSSISIFYFVKLNNTDFSISKCFFFIILKVLFHFFIGLALFNLNTLYRSFGEIKAIYYASSVKFDLAMLRSMLED